MLETIQVNTSDRSMAVDITDMVARKVQESGVRGGLCILSVTHTTAGIIINEGADPDVMEDIKNTLESLIPWRGGYKHMEGNSAAHIKSVLTGNCAQVIIDNGRLLLGTWQRIFLWEFDGPRTRKIRVKIMSG
jgi:secondary thiamine-phosphate synthase enzyme